MRFWLLAAMSLLSAQSGGFGRSRSVTVFGAVRQFQLLTVVSLLSVQSDGFGCSLQRQFKCNQAVSAACCVGRAQYTIRRLRPLNELAHWPARSQAMLMVSLNIIYQCTENVTALFKKYIENAVILSCFPL